MHCVSVALPWIAALLVGAAVGRVTATPLIRRLRASVDRLNQLVLHDSLSGLLNRSGLEDAYLRSAGHDRYLILVDLDAFKVANDQHGHPVGDQVLSAVGRRLAELAAPHGGWAGRLGGDEFAVILPTVTAATATTVAVAATAPVAITDLPTGPLTVSGSAGLALAPAHYPWTRALTNADIALYHGKHAGTPITYEPGMAYPRTPSTRRRARDDTNQ